MSKLLVFNEKKEIVGSVVTDRRAISQTLDTIGVLFEQWEAAMPLADDSSQDEILEAYKKQVDNLKEKYNFASADVVSLHPDHPDRVAFRSKFLNEHTHSDFEVRFFVDGSGLFYLHVDDKIYLVECTAGDLISVPAGTTHWFDMGALPSFKCIRLFTTEQGWVGHFTGSEIAGDFPDYDNFRKNY